MASLKFIPPKAKPEPALNQTFYLMKKPFRAGSNNKIGDIMKYVCDICGWIYDPAVGDPDNGIAPGTDFKDIPEDWTCPECGADTDSFSQA